MSIGQHFKVAIIGGGFTGVATAVELAERGLKVAIVETNRIGWGASGRNGGQVTGSLSGDEAMRAQMRNHLGAEVDDFIWHLRWRGHQVIEQRVARRDILRLTDAFTDIVVSDGIPYWHFLCRR